jgi:hypothetical protein
MSLLTRWAKAFGHFWWDFLVGDTPELFAATVVIVVAAVLLGHHHNPAWVILPIMAVVFLVASAYRGRRRAPAPEATEGDPTQP